jgi:peptidoglycan/xylan/chitin deacetylase (PgdA/CDA1 family)
MKKIFTNYCLLLILFVSQAGISQTIDSLYEIGAWQGFRTAAVSFTFDDGTPNQFTQAVPIFNEFGYHLTLFTITRSAALGLPNWSVLQDAANHGHEIAAHTLTHTSFADLSDSLELAELRDCQGDIDSHIVGQKCVTMAYPFCVTGNKALCASYYIGARICSGNIETRTPRDFMAISSIVCGTEGSIKTADNFINRTAAAVKSKGWCVFLLHGVDNDGGWSPVTSDVLRSTLQQLSENPNDYWVDSFGNVVKYIKERNAASVKELSLQDSTLTVQVTDTLDNEIFNQQISIRRALPQNWPAATAAQNDQPVNSAIIETDGVRYVQFDAIPDNGDVILSKAADTSVRTQNTAPQEFKLMQNYPNPFNPQTTIKYAVPMTEHVTIKLYNLRGGLIKTLVDQTHSAGVYTIVVRGAGLPSGIYLYDMQAGSFNDVKRLVLIK